MSSPDQKSVRDEQKQLKPARDEQKQLKPVVWTEQNLRDFIKNRDVEDFAEPLTNAVKDLFIKAGLLKFDRAGIIELAELFSQMLIKCPFPITWDCFKDILELLSSGGSAEDFASLFARLLSTVPFTRLSYHYIGLWGETNDVYVENHWNTEIESLADIILALTGTELIWNITEDKAMLGPVDFTPLFENHIMKRINKIQAISNDSLPVNVAVMRGIYKRGPALLSASLILLWFILAATNVLPVNSGVFLLIVLMLILCSPIKYCVNPVYLGLDMGVYEVNYDYYEPGRPWLSLKGKRRYVGFLAGLPPTCCGVRINKSFIATVLFCLKVFLLAMLGVKTSVTHEKTVPFPRSQIKYYLAKRTCQSCGQEIV